MLNFIKINKMAANRRNDIKKSPMIIFFHDYSDYFNSLPKDEVYSGDGDRWIITAQEVLLLKNDNSIKPLTSGGHNRYKHSEIDFLNTKI